MAAAGCQALSKDMDYDEAVSDFKAALELVHGDERREVQQKLHQMEQKKDEWNGGQKDMRYNERNGFPDGAWCCGMPAGTSKISQAETF